jgi:hypothetical protein
VIVWAAVSLFSQITSPPTSIVTILGMKQPSAVASQPGTDDPSAFVTVAVVWSANAGGTMAISETIANNTINDFAFSIFYFLLLAIF